MRRLVHLRLRLLRHQISPLLVLISIDLIERSNLLKFISLESLVLLPLLYYWTLFKPEKLTAGSLCIVGLVDDALSGAFMGQTSLFLLLIYGLLLMQRQSMRDMTFRFTWLAFCTFMGLVTLIEWSLASFLKEEILSPLPLLGKMILSMLGYPWFHKVVRALDHRS